MKMAGPLNAQTPESFAVLQEAGVRCAHRYTVAKFPKSAVRELKRRAREAVNAVVVHASTAKGNSESVFDSMRLIRSSARECQDARWSDHPALVDETRHYEPRACVIAREFLSIAENHFSDGGLIAFLEGFQSVTEIEMGEIWALKPALQFVSLERMAGLGPASWPALVTGLRGIAEVAWKDLFECISIVERVLAHDPGAAYTAMDYDSRDRYRRVIADLAKHSSLSEHAVADAAITLAEHAAEQSDGTRAAIRRTHVGYFLVDSGLPALRTQAGYRPPFTGRFRDLVVTYPNGFYLIGIELFTILIVVAALSGSSPLTRLSAGFLFLILPATQAAIEFMNNFMTSLLRPAVLAKLDFSKGIPEVSATLVAVPTLLINETQIRKLVLDLEIRFLANRDANLYFALLTDSPDCDQQNDQDEGLQLCRELIEGLNARYRSDQRTPFYLLHRHPVFNVSEERWMGWERKRGKLLDLNQLVGGLFDSFPVKVGDVSALRRLKYVITLDSDTQLPPGAAAALVGAISHPLNRAVVDPHTRTVVEGYGILQPRIGISMESASRSRLAGIYSGQTGFDIYTRAISDVYQDLFGEGIFTGKGIYEIETLLQTLQLRFPDNTLLSHDLIEGAYARVGLVSDIELIDDYPSHFSAYSRRKHRWVRGDWQILKWLFESVPDYHGRMVTNPTSLISRWKIFDNLRRSLIEPATLFLFVAGWIYLPGTPRWWTLVTLAMLCLPLCSNLLFALLRLPLNVTAFRSWARDISEMFVKGIAFVLLSLVFLLHQTLLSLDAIVRSMLRVFVTGRRLLEWETAEEAEITVRRKATVDIYLEWTPWLAVAIGCCVWLIRPAALPIAAPILALWFISLGFSAWLNRAWPRATNRELKDSDIKFLYGEAEKIYRFFHDWSSPATNWLIPDSVRADGILAARLSPTNMGFLLNARIAAVHFGFLSIPEFAFQTRQTLDRLGALPKHRGHMLNWYDTETLAALEPQFVSTVDSGNLVACLWTLKHAALSFAADPPSNAGLSAEVKRELDGIAETCERLVHDMDFTFLYHERKKVLSVGYDLAAQRLESSSYDLLASESRIAIFVAVAKGDIPHEAWFHLGRRHTTFRGGRVLVSWTGTMFEYLMPMLWMRHYPGTIVEESAKAAVRVQREYARLKGAPWGISESACRSDQGSDYGYAAFGIPELAMKRMKQDVLVIAPYATFLAATVDPVAAIENLHRMGEYGWSGVYGMYEAVDYTRAGGEVIRSWMAHHQGMGLLALCNLLYSNPMQRYFHSEPQIKSTELLLQERVPHSIKVESEELIPQLASAAGTS